MGARRAEGEALEYVGETVLIDLPGVAVGRCISRQHDLCRVFVFQKNEGEMMP